MGTGWDGQQDFLGKVGFPAGLEEGRARCGQAEEGLTGPGEEWPHREAE